MNCLMPINIKAKEGSERDTVYVPVPCGKCPACKQKRVNAWVFRLLQEEKRHKILGAHFITLTYDSPPISENGFMTLDKKDVQKFMKRLRKATGRKSIRYYICGEYGSQTMRPHYHAIMFDVLPEEVQKAWQYVDENAEVKGGFVHFGQVSAESIAYTLKYICKDGKIPMHEKDDRQPEFALMSKKMGSNYLSPQVVRWHHENEAFHLVLPGGQIQCLPRYYRDKIFNDSDKLNYSRVVSKKFAVQFDEAVKAAGGLEQYYRLRFETVLHLQKIQKSNQSKRSQV